MLSLTLVKQIRPLIVSRPLARLNKHWQMLRVHDREEVIYGHSIRYDRVDLDHAELLPPHVFV